MLELNDFRLVAICPDETSHHLKLDSYKTLDTHSSSLSAARRKQQKLSRSMAARSLGREKNSFPHLASFFSPFQTHTHTKVTHQHSLVCLPFHMMIFMIFSAVLAAAPCCHRHQRSTLLFLLFFFTLHTGYIYCFSLLLLLI